MRRSETGATLVEVLVAVMVLGVAFLAVLGGLGTSIASSDLHRRQAVAETVVRRYAEAVKAQPFAATCPANYTMGTFTAPTAPFLFTATAPVVVYYDDVDKDWSGSCSAVSVQLVP
jgi:Tfp pilus assembly protein PilV